MCLELPPPVDAVDGILGKIRDFIQTIEEIISSYCPKCFYSKHLSLREATIHKFSLALLRLSQSKYDFLKQILTTCGALKKVFNDHIIQERQHSNIDICCCCYYILFVCTCYILYYDYLISRNEKNNIFLKSN